MLASDESFPAGDVVEECEGVEVGTGGDGLAVGLQDVLLLLEEGEVRADAVEEFSFFQLGFPGEAVSVHNDNIIL